MQIVSRRIARLGLVALALGAMGLGGCVRQTTYDDVDGTNKALTAQNQQLADRVKSLESALEDARRRASRVDMTSSESSSTLSALQQQNEDLRRRLADYDARLQGLAAGPVDQVTDSALQDLANRYSDILSYDSARGMLRFNSDLTFASGSFELTSGARGTIDALAKILRELPSAQQYDIRVVGHTDSQPVSQRTARPFKNNVELSAFRSISVRNALTNEGIAANRVEFAGFGEFRPQVENSPNGNTPANRRVEVFMTRSTLGQNSPGMPPVIRRATPAAPPAARPATPGAPAAVTPAPVTPAKPDSDIMK
jgi:chemotaxis protein MotB